MKNLNNLGVKELSNNTIRTISGGGPGTGSGSLFRSSLWIGSKAFNVALITLGFLAGLGDGISNGIDDK
tara:strand:+ start:9357 stop:9563 length:207 start_codon:yes stop_codon:yes gene_type:complete